MLRYLKNNIILIIVIAILIPVGVFCIFIRGEDVMNIFSVVALIYLLAIGGWMIFSGIRYKNFLDNNSNFLNKSKGYIIQGSILILAGIFIMVFPDLLVRLVIGAFLIIQPLITLIKHNNKALYLKHNFWKFIVGLIFLLAFTVILEVLFIIIGIGLIILAGFIVYLLIINYKDQNYPNLITKYLMMYIIKKNK